jgi:hypothetical protein
MCSGSCFLIFPKYVFCAWALLLSSFISFVLFSCTDTTLVLVLPGTFSFQLNHWPSGSTVAFMRGVSLIHLQVAKAAVAFFFFFFLWVTYLGYVRLS